MSRIRMLWASCSSYLRRNKLDAELDEELTAHLDLAIEEYMQRGMDARQARTAALRAFGGVTQVREMYRERRGLPWLECAFRDLRFATLKLMHSPAFALTAILTLAVGIGANVIVFSVLNEILLRPLKVSHPESIVEIASRHESGEGQSYPDFRDYQARNHSFSGIVAYRILRTTMEANRSLFSSWGVAASGNYFDVLGLNPALGRFFHATDEHGLASAPYIVLSYNFWRRQFGMDPHVIGRVIRLNQHPLTVIGVAPEGFSGTNVYFRSDYWIPAVNAQQVTGWDDFDWRRHRDYALLGRLRPGVTPQQASQEMGGIAVALSKQYSDDQGLNLVTRKPGPAGNSEDPIRKILLGTTLLAALILLAACANLANIFAARACDRSSELAIRLALGSSRWAVARQLLVEAILLALGGGLVGTCVAFALLQASNHTDTSFFPNRFQIEPDAHVYLLALALSIVSGLVFAVLPARQVWRTDILQAIRGNVLLSRVLGRVSVRDLLLLLQVGVCTLLVSSCLVTLRGMFGLLHVPLGIAANGVTLAQVDLKMAGVPDDQSRIVQKRLLTTASSLPGVTAAATSDYAPFLGTWKWAFYSWDTTDFTPAHVAGAAVTYLVSPGYFSTAGTRLERGRDITENDKPGSPAVAVVNESFARRLFGTTDVIGKRFKLFDPVRLEIIGVVQDGKYEDMGEKPQPAIFLAYAQGIGPFMVSGPVTVLVRSKLPPQQVASALRHTLPSVVPAAPFSIISWSDAVDRSTMPEQTAAVVLGAMGLIAALLAVTGLFGMASYSVSQRMKEQGIRVALGARRVQVMRSTLGRTLLILFAGTGAGLVSGLFTGRVLAQVMTLPDTSDPMQLTFAVLVMLVLGVVATWIPGRRAFLIDPARLLREP